MTRAPWSRKSRRRASLPASTNASRKVGEEMSQRIGEHVVNLTILQPAATAARWSGDRSAGVCLIYASDGSSVNR